MKNLQKLNLAQLPTPIMYLSQLSQSLGKIIYVKRDDFSGLELSGNKIRKLEYSLAEALSLNCDTVITTGAIQSNHCRATAFACNQLGLECHLLLTGEKPDLDAYEGNTFLDLMAGATIHFIEPGSDRKSHMAKLAAKLEAEGRTPYLIPVGASNAVGSLGYMNCFREILSQEQESGHKFDTIVLAVGSGGTYAGLWYENERLSAGKDIYGVCVAEDAVTFTQDINKIVRDLQASFEPEAEPQDYSFLLNESYIGEGYAKTTTQEINFLIKIAQQTGIVFDPCYTGKAFRGMVQEVLSGDLKDKERILFLHTGGLFGWTAPSRRMALEILQNKVEEEH